MSTLKQRPQSRSTSAQPAAPKMRGGSSAAGSPAVTDVRATGLLNYKYASINKSILCNSFMGTFWDWIATVMPTWVSPNMVTAFGAVCSWLVLPLVHYCRSSLSESVTKDGITVHSIDEKSMPTFQAVYGVALVCLWLYNTLDNVDGKLARQRKLSSPLGQWFDHGCDAYTVASLISSLGWMLDLKLGWALVLWSGLLATWIVVNWEEHLLHRMRFDARTALRYFSADELEYTALGLATYTTIYGHGFWHQASWLKTWAPLGADNAWTDLNNGELLTAAISAVLVKSILEAMVFVAMEIGTDKFIASLGKLIPFWTIIGLCDVWLLLVGNNEAYAMIAISAIFSRSAITIVDATLVKTPIPTFHFEMIVVIANIINARMDDKAIVDKDIAVQVTAGIMFVMYLWRLASNAKWIAGVIKIPVFAVPSK